MVIDYTRYFKTEDELVNFLNLPNEKQDEYLGALIADDSEASKEMCCNVMSGPKKDIGKTESK